MKEQLGIITINIGNTKKLTVHFMARENSVNSNKKVGSIIINTQNPMTR